MAEHGLRLETKSDQGHKTRLGDERMGDQVAAPTSQLANPSQLTGRQFNCQLSISSRQKVSDRRTIRGRQIAVDSVSIPYKHLSIEY